MTKRTRSVPPQQRCPWCSSLAPAAAERCPSCGAALPGAASDNEADIPGVTQVDPVLGMRRRVARPNRLVGWLADVDTEPTPTVDLAARRPGTPAAGKILEGVDATSVAPPSDEVRREMQRLELEALRTELEERAAAARVAAMDARQATPAGTPPEPPPSPADAEDGSGT